MMRHPLDNSPDRLDNLGPDELRRALLDRDHFNRESWLMSRQPKPSILSRAARALGIGGKHGQK